MSHRVSSMLGIRYRALRIEPTFSPMCSRSVQTLHPPLSVQAVNRRLRTSKHSSSTKVVAYVRREREESGSRLAPSNEEKEGRFQLSITMGKFQSQLRVASVALLTTHLHIVILEWGSSLPGDPQASHWRCLKMLLTGQEVNKCRYG